VDAVMDSRIVVNKQEKYAERRERGKSVDRIQTNHHHHYLLLHLLRLTSVNLQ